MLICFGVSWPINIAKAWKARSTKGISVLFYCLILLGYLVGIAAKLSFYVLNTLMVAAGIAIWFRNRALENKAA